MVNIRYFIYTLIIRISIGISGRLFIVPASLKVSSSSPCLIYFLYCYSLSTGRRRNRWKSFYYQETLFYNRCGHLHLVDFQPPRCSCRPYPDQTQPHRPICSHRPHLMVDDQVRDAATPLPDHSSGSPEEEAKDPKGKQVSFSFNPSSLNNRKRKTKAEEDITLETLRQHFAGSLKDAAKNIGVCPTTLKRICRQHGISRWPSRKIKKVGHSLRKLQVVMDSVEGVQGSRHLASFYSSFPQLHSSSFPLINATQSVHVPPKSPPSSSGSQSSSGSSTCCSSEDQQIGGFQKPALSHSQQLTLCSLQEEQRAVRVTSSLPPLPFSTAPRKSKNKMKVKAMFGNSKLRMRLRPQSRLTDLRREIAKRFAMDDVLRSNCSLKYLDDDQEWVLLTCDADLEECIQVYKSSLKETISILVNHPLSLFPPLIINKILKPLY